MMQKLLISLSSTMVKQKSYKIIKKDNQNGKTQRDKEENNRT